MYTNQQTDNQYLFAQKQLLLIEDQFTFYNNIYIYNIHTQCTQDNITHIYIYIYMYIYIYTININHQIAQLVAAFHQVILASTLSSEEQQRLRRALEAPRTEAVAPVPRDDGNMLFYPRSPIFACFQLGFYWQCFCMLFFCCWKSTRFLRAKA